MPYINVTDIAYKHEYGALAQGIMVQTCQALAAITWSSGF